MLMYPLGKFNQINKKEMLFWGVGAVGLLVWDGNNMQDVLKLEKWVDYFVKRVTGDRTKD